MGLIWLFVGSSPTAPANLERAIAEQQPDHIITCNSGIKLVPLPSVFVCVDHIASRRFEAEARAAQKHGTRLVTLHRDCPRALAERRVGFYDEFMGIPGDGEPSRDRWGPFRYSGPLCMEYALKHGATKLVLVGAEGYKSRCDYFDPDEPSRRDPTQRAEDPTISTLRVIVPAMQKLMQVYHDVPWICYGTTAFPFAEPNWSWIA